MSATLLSYHRDGPWMYWTPMVVFLAVGVALAWPGLAQLVTGPAGGREPLATQDKDATADGEPSAVPVFPAGFVAVVSAEAVVHADAVASLAPGRRRSRAWR